MAEKKRLAELKAAKEAKAWEQVLRNRAAAELAMREACMIWLLCNTASGIDEANVIIGIIADALQIRIGQVNARRTLYVNELEKRTGKIWGSGESLAWAKLPGSRGTALPDFCETCGGMKTEGTKCVRRSCRKVRK